VDPDEYRATSLQQWERSAPGWAARARRLERMAAPVSQWLVQAARLQPGHVVLELAAGPGETGLLAAELIAPGGRLISSDFAESMVEAACTRAAELGLDGVVECRRLDAESLDLDTASVDAVLCRWGYMLMADPEAALRETRRVLRPGGRVSLAAWDAPEANPWVTAALEVARERFDLPRPAPDDPGPFSFARAGRIGELLEAAGFLEPSVEAVDLRMAYASFDEWWEVTLDLNATMRGQVAALDPDTLTGLRADVEAALRAHALAEAGLVLPGRTLVAVASA
jgi:SAM-dependent methyltransferase